MNRGLLGWLLLDKAGASVAPQILRLTTPIKVQLSSNQPRSPPSAPTYDPAFKRIVMYVFVGTKGGYNRLKIIKLLREEPMNANRIADRLSLDYKTVQHHLRLLEANDMVVSSPKGAYGAVLSVTPYMDRHMPLLEEMWAKFGKS